MGGIQGFIREIDNNLRLRFAFMDDRPIILTPCKAPPSPFTVISWAKEKLMKNKILQQEKTRQNANKVDVVDNEDQDESKSKHTDKHANNNDAIHLQESTSPCSLFSPVEQTFTLDEAGHPGNDARPSPAQRNEHSFGVGVQPKEHCPSTPSGQSLKYILSAPQHSTPISTGVNKINPSQLPLLTPIVIGHLDKLSPGEKSGKSIAHSGVAGTQTRRQLIPSQLKVFSPSSW